LIIGANNNTVGGSAAGARNVISGNNQNGIEIHSSASGNVIQGNYIGTDVGGTMDLGNTQHGITVSNGSSSTQIGGSTAGEGNVISGNDQLGILLNQTPSATIRGNLIGTDKNGTGSVGNSNGGIFLDVGVGSTAIGGAAAGSGNTIANNGAAGLVLSNLSGTGNSILSNSFFNNTGIGIDLNQDGVQTANDAGDADSGANEIQNFPVVSLAQIDGNGNLNVDYVVDTATASATYSLTIQFFEADSAVGGEGAVLFSSDTYSSASAQSTRSVNLGSAAPLGISAGDVIVATATDASGNTSEFSSAFTVTLPPPTVVYVDDDFAGFANGQAIADAIPNNSVTEPATFGHDAFAVLQDGLAAVLPGGTVNMNQGMYNGATITQSVTLIGTTGAAADVVIDPSSGDGLTLMPGAGVVTIESVRITGGDNGINSSGVTNLTLRNVQVDTNTGAGLGIDSTTSLGLVDVVVFGNTLNSVLSSTPTLFWSANSGPSVDQFGVTATQIRYTRGATLQNPIDHAGLSSLFINTGAGADQVSATPVPGLMMGFEGGDPTTLPGDTIDVDFLGNVGGQTVTGVGMGRYNALGGSPPFGQIDYVGFEAATHRNAAPLNLFIAPEADLGSIRVVGEGPFADIFTGEDVLMGRVNTSEIDTLTYLGSDSFNDQLILDLTGSQVLPPGGTTMRGGEGGNDLLTIIANDSTPEILYAPSGETTGDGDIDVGDRTISFTGLEPVPIIFVGPSSKPAEVRFANVNDVVTIQNGAIPSGNSAAGQAALEVTATSGGVAIERAYVRNATDMIIDTIVSKGGVVADGDDTITIASADNGHGNQNLTIRTGVGANTVAITGKVSVGTLSVGGATLTLGSNDRISDSAKLVLENGTTFDTQSRSDTFSQLTVNPGATLKGAGTINVPVTVGGGTVAPGGAAGGTGILKTGSVNLSGTSTIQFDVNGTTVGTGHDRLDVTGTVTLGGAHLNVAGTLSAAPAGSVIVVISNDGTDPVSGTFDSLPEGALVTLPSGEQYRISYKGGGTGGAAGNDVTLTRLSTLQIRGSAEDDLLVVTATNANSGKYQLTTDADNSTGARQVGPEVPFSTLAGFEFLAGDGNDTLRINNPTGAVFAPTLGVTYDGQNGNDELQLLGGSTASALISGPQFGSAAVTYATGGVVTYQAESVLESVTTDRLTLKATTPSPGAQFGSFDLADDTNTNDGQSLLRTREAVVSFKHPSRVLRIDTAERGALDDTLSVSKLDGLISTLELQLNANNNVVIGTPGAVPTLANLMSLIGRNLSIHSPLSTGTFDARVVGEVQFGAGGRIESNEIGSVSIVANGPLSMAAGSTIRAGTRGVVLSTMTQAADLRLTGVTTTGAATIKADGRILDAADTHTDLVAAGAVLTAGDAVGDSNNPLDLDVGKLEGTAGIRHFAVAEMGELVVGGVSPTNGVYAPGGFVQLLASSFIIGEDVVANARNASNAIELRTEALPGPGQGLTVKSGASLDASFGGMVLDINDNVTLANGTKLQAKDDVVINTGGGTGEATIVRLDGTISATMLILGGNAGDDQFVLTNLPANTIIGINGQGGTDRVEIHGTTGDDQLDFTASGVTTRGSTFTFDSIEDVRASLLAGNDSVSVNDPTVSLSLDGGDPTSTPGDTLTIRGGANRVRLTGVVTMNLASVTHKNFEQVSVIGNNGPVILSDLAGRNRLAGGGGGTLLVARPSQPFLSGFSPLVTFNLFSAITVELDSEGGEPPVLEFEGTDGNDTFQLLGSDVQVGDGMPPITIEGASAQFNVMGGLGDDTLTIDVTGGFISKPIVFDGGGGFDGIRVTGTPVSPIAKETYQIVETEFHRARLFFENTEGNVLMSIEGVNIEPVETDTPSTLIEVRASSLSDQIDLGFSGSGGARVSISNWENVSFKNKTGVVIRGGAGDDTINIRNFEDGYSGLLEVFAEDPGDADRLVITAGGDLVYRPFYFVGSQLHSAGVILRNGRELQFFGVSDVSIDGAISLTVNQQPTPTSTDETIIVEQVESEDYTLNINGLVPLHVVNVDTTTIDPGGSVQGDKLIVRGSAFDDQMIVDMTGGARTIDVHGRRFNFDNTEALILETGEGHDTTSLQLRDGIAVQVHGGGTADGDVLTMRMHDTTKEIRFADSTIRLGSGETIAHSGLSRVVMDARGENSGINVLGTAGDDILHWTPQAVPALYDLSLAVDGALLQRGNDGPVFEIAQFPAASIQPGSGTDQVVFHGSADDDSFLIQRSGTATQVIAMHQNTIPVSVTTSELESLSVLGEGGDDRLLVDPANGLVLYPGGINFDGGHGLDALEFDGQIQDPNAFTDVVYKLTGPGSGTVIHTLQSGGAGQQLNFTGLEPIRDLVPGTLTINTEANPSVSAANAITVSSAEGLGRIEVDANEAIKFANKTDVTIDAGSGPDSIGVSNFSVGYSGNLTVKGGEPGDDDKLVISGTTASDTFTYQPGIAPHAGGFTLDGRVLSFDGMEEIVINGLEGADSITAKGPVGLADDDLVPPVQQNQDSADFWRIPLPTGLPIVAGMVVPANSRLDGTLSFGETTLTLLDAETQLDFAGSSPLGFPPVLFGQVPANNSNAFLVVDLGPNASFQEYRLFAIALDGEQATDEMELAMAVNDSPGTATRLNSPMGQGTVPFGDVDYYMFHLDDPTDVVVAVDNDPERDGTITRTSVAIIQGTADERVLVPAGPSSSSGRSGTPPIRLSRGDYFIRVANSGVPGDPTNYRFGVISTPADDPAGTNPPTPEREPNNDRSNATGFGVMRPGKAVATKPGPNDRVLLEPFGNDESRLRFNESTPLEIQDIEAVTVDPAGGNDTITVNTSDLTDSATVSRGGTVVNGQSFAFSNNEDIHLNTGHGDDLVRVTSGLAVPITIDTGGPSGSDVVQYSASKLAPDMRLAADLFGQTITEVLGPLSLAPVAVIAAETIALNGELLAGKANLTVLGTAAHDRFDYDPFGPDDAIVSSAPLNLSIIANSIGDLLIDGRDGTDAVTLFGNAATNIISVARGATTIAIVDQLQPLRLPAATESLTIEAGLGDDFVGVTGSGGPSLAVVGGGPGATDSLLFVQDVTSPIVNLPPGGIPVVTPFRIEPGSLPTTARVQLGGDVTTLSEIDQITLQAVSAMIAATVSATDASDVISVTPFDLGGTLIPRVTISNLLDFRLANVAQGAPLTVRALDGDDKIHVAPRGLANFTISVDAGGPGASDELVVDGTDQDDSFAYTPGADDQSGTLAVTGAAAQYSGAESITLTGLGGMDSLTVNATSGEDSIQLHPFGLDSGRVRVNAFSPVGFSTMENVTIDGAANPADTEDQVIVEGTALNDTASFNSTLLGINRQNFDLPNVESVRIDLAGGDDTVAFLAASTTAVLLLDPGPIVARGGLPTTTLGGVEHVTLGAGGNNVEVATTADDNELNYRPTGADAGLLRRTGLDVEFQLNSVALLEVDPLAGHDTLIVEGNPSDNGFQLRQIPLLGGGSIQTELRINNGPNPLQEVRFRTDSTEALRVLGAGGSDTFNVAPSATTGVFVDGGDPIGAGDSLRLVANQATLHRGPQNDEGAFLIPGAMPVSFDHIEDAAPLSVTVPPGHTLANVQSVPNPSPANTPTGATFPLGFLEITVQVPASFPTMVSITIPPGVTAPTTYYKYGREPANTTPHWYEFKFNAAACNAPTSPDDCTGAEFKDDDGDGKTDRILLHLIDGRRGDDDLAANGIVVDPGGPGVEQAGPGNVDVALIGGRLVVTGDKGDNHVRVVPGTTGRQSVRVIGQEGTTVNGAAQPVEFAKVRRGLQVDLGDGDDELFLTTKPSLLRGSVDLATGNGNDLVRLESVAVRGLLSIQTGTGDDTVEIVDMVLSQPVEVLLGEGDDTVTVERSRFRGPINVIGADGRDALTIVESLIAGPLFNDLGDGDAETELVDTVLDRKAGRDATGA
jgi:hypothetical protein